MGTTQQQSVYLLGRSDHETARLQRQAQLYGPLTRRLLVRLGSDQVWRSIPSVGDLHLRCADNAVATATVAA